jgi:hypothetical protein
METHSSTIYFAADRNTRNTRETRFIRDQL